MLCSMEELTMTALICTLREKLFVLVLDRSFYSATVYIYISLPPEYGVLNSH